MVTRSNAYFAMISTQHGQGWQLKRYVAADIGRIPTDFFSLVQADLLSIALTNNPCTGVNPSSTLSLRHKQVC